MQLDELQRLKAWIDKLPNDLSLVEAQAQLDSMMDEIKELEDRGLITREDIDELTIVMMTKVKK